MFTGCWICPSNISEMTSAIWDWTYYGWDKMKTFEFYKISLKYVPYTPFTQGLRPLCLPCATTKLDRSPVKAQRRQKGCLGRSGVAQRTFRPRHGRHGHREVLSMFKTVAQRLPEGQSFTGRSREAGGRHTHRRGRRMDAQGSAIGRPVKMRTVVNILYQFKRCFCLSCATIVPPLTDQ